MKVQTFEDLIEWTRALHQRLSECLAHCSSQAEETRVKWLLRYLADHEATLERVVEGFKQRADPKALNTWVYDFQGHEPIEPHSVCDAPYANLSLEEVSAAVLDLHNQVIRLYRYLLGRANIPEARELVETLLAMEEHEAMRLARQAGRMQDV